MTDGTTTVINSYNADGYRIQKVTKRTNYSETHRYTYNGGKLVYDIIRFNDNGNIYNHTILMSYDENGRPFMITYNNISYYYLLNMQGDVMGIMDVSGNLQVAYTYDAWGNVLSVTGPMADTMGQYNQIRYRGYVYDPETNLYFLNSRFYDPEKGRFISADVLVSTGQGMLGNNMFAYCRNNPVNRIDISGLADTAVEEELDDDVEVAPNIPGGGGPGGNTGNPAVGTAGGVGGGGSVGGGTSGSGYGIGGNNNSINVNLSFKSEAKLNRHYETHNPDFDNAFSSPQEYLDAANYVIQNGEYIESQNAYVRFYGLNGHANYAFVGLSHDGLFITTFHLKKPSQIDFK